MRRSDGYLDGAGGTQSVERKKERKKKPSNISDGIGIGHFGNEYTGQR